MTLVDKVRNRVTRARQHRWRERPYQSTESHIVIGGTPRSGTTLIRRTLDRHPAICCGPESSIFLPGAVRVGPVAAGFEMEEGALHAMLAASPSQGAFIDAFASRYRLARGRRRWAEKTPLNVRYIDWILERFPEARFVHVIRDGRDVVCSMRQHPDRRWVDGAWEKVHRPLSLDQYARRWVLDTEAGIAHRGHPRYLEVRYEDLVQDPVSVLGDLLDDLGETLDPAILVEPDTGTSASDAAAPQMASGTRHHAGTAISTRSMGRWRTDLTPEERALVQGIAGATLTRLGYPDA
jgi:protein-tyrosine sulfotransferase